MNGHWTDPACLNRELAVGWALHCLEPDEEARFAAHLATCDDCRRTVSETEEVGAMLAMTGPEYDPPPELEQRILAAAGVAPVPGRLAGVDSRSVAAHTAAPVDELAQRRNSRNRRFGLAAAAVVLVAISVGLGIRVVQLDSDRDDLVAQRDANSFLVEQVLEGAADPDVARVAIATSEGEPMAVMLGHGSTMTFVPVHLPANQPGRNTYVLWGLGNGPARALDAFDVSGDTPPVRTVRLGPNTDAFTGFAVSLEPGHAPPVAPSKVMASGTVQS